MKIIDYLHIVESSIGLVFAVAVTMYGSWKAASGLASATPENLIELSIGTLGALICATVFFLSARRFVKTRSNARAFAREARRGYVIRFISWLSTAAAMAMILSN